MRKITADRIFTGRGEVLTDHVIILEDNGRILSIDSSLNHEESSVQKFSGTLLPGYINTHCHLELSHMKGLVPTGTGLIPFISSVVKLRDFPEAEIQEGIRNADQEMWENGIVAVGDICNKLDTREVKENSKISYYSFIELFDFLQDAHTEHFFDQYKEVYEGQSDRGLNRKSMAPHSPYSVTPSLFKKINDYQDSDRTVSIHNQECHDENYLFMNGSGALFDFYQDLGMNLDNFRPTGTPSVNYALEHMDKKAKSLLVHNTICTDSDIKFILNWSPNVFFATCANANLYIENKLPDYKIFLENNAKMTIGTDSLSSNWQLDIWEEIKTIKKYNSYLNLAELLTWATYNGAESLSYQHLLGSLEPGKNPGINLISHVLGENEDDISQVTSQKII